MVKTKVWKYVNKFDGFPKDTDFEIVLEELEPLKDGEFIAEALFLSVDPYMRPYAKNLLLGSTFMGTQVAKITESKSQKFPVGKFVVGAFGWRTHTLVKEDSSPGMPTYVLPDFGDLPLSLGVGTLGMPGNTAYFGFLEICKPKEGETVVVSGAAGAVGHIVGQIAKTKGCKVIGIAGSDEKGKWLISELGFDHFVNYKTENVYEAVKKVAPQGVDCYFDNVGGDISHGVLKNMNPRGRISVCGAISSYNVDVPKEPVVQFPLVFQELRMEGFLVLRWIDRWMEGIEQMLKWVKEGKIKYHETVTYGLENTPKAFIGMLKGDNIGKAIVKL